MVKEAMGIENPCALRECCPYMNFQAVAKVLTERDYLSKRIEDMEGVMRLAEEKILSLEAEIKQFKEEKEMLLNKLHQVCRRPFKPNKKIAEAWSNPQIKQGASSEKPKKIDEYIDIYPDLSKAVSDLR